MRVRESFFGKVTLLAGGTIAGHVILFCVYPLLTRLYTPTDFGVLGVYAAVLSILTQLAAWRFNAAIPVPKHDLAALNLLVLCLVAVVTTTTLTAVVIWQFGITIAKWLDTPELTTYLWFLPLGLLGSGGYTSLNAWAARVSAYGLIAKTRISQSCLQVVLQVGVGVFGNGALGLILGDAAGRAGGAGTLAALVTKRNQQLRKQVSVSRMMAVARRYRHLPIFSTWSTLLNGIGSQLPSLVLVVAFGTAVAGWFNLALLVIQAPVQVLSQSIAQVFLTDAGEAHRQGRLGEYTSLIFRRLVGAAAGATLLLIVIAPSLFAVLFGDAWTESGHYVRWLAPYVFITFITAHLPSAVIILGLQRAQLTFEIIYFVCRVAALVLGIYFADPFFTVVIYASLSLLGLASYACWLFQRANCSARALLISIGREFALAAMLVSPVLIGQMLFANHGLWVWVAVSAVLVALRAVRCLKVL